MHRSLLRIIALFMLMASFQATASEKDWFFKPYTGVDIGLQNLSWETGFGDYHFAESYAVANFNAGAWLHPYIGVELGYEHTFARDHKSFYNASNVPFTGTPVLGFTGFVGTNSQSYLSDVRMGGFVASLMLRYPVMETTEIFGLIGANWARMHFSTMMFQDGGNAANRPVYWHSDRKAVFRVGFGVKHQIVPNLGGRIMYVYEDTTELESNVFPGFDVGGIAMPTAPVHLFTAKPKSSHLVMAGLYYQADWV